MLALYVMPFMILNGAIHIYYAINATSWIFSVLALVSMLSSEVLKVWEFELP